LAKYIRIPHFGIKLQKICSDQKTDSSIEFVASNYPKMTASMPQSNSGTPRAKEKFGLGFCALQPAINAKKIP
jgi:hypothetical protein